MFELVEKHSQNARIKVVGVGGGGGNAVNTMVECGLDGVDFMAANTDLQCLQANLAPVKIQVGRELTKGLGAGANPDIGRNAALEDQRTIVEHLQGADMVFITAGMGGGTGTGGAPVIARIAKELGALTVAVVTKPFTFEGRQRGAQADRGIAELKNCVDTLITIPNEKLLETVSQDMTVIDAFKQADQVLHQAVKGIADLIVVHGLINLDFADVRTVMSEMGMALMGTGMSSGENRAMDAATKAIASPLLEDTSIKGATGILINITGGSDMTLYEISEASRLIQEEAHEDANILFGAVIDENIKDQIRVTVIATGFNKPLMVKASRPITASSNVNHSTGLSSNVGINIPPSVEKIPQQPSLGVSMATTPVYTSPSHRNINSVAASRAMPHMPVKEEIRTDFKSMTREIGVLEYQGDEYDIPTFLRKQAD